MSDKKYVPVTDANGNKIGKAELVVTQDGINAVMYLDHQYAADLLSAADVGQIAGYSFGPNLTPAHQAFETTGQKNHQTVELKQVPPGRLGEEEINNRFGFHKAKIEGPNPSATEHAAVRIEFMNFAKWLDKNLPGCREKSVAFTELESASMWAHKAIARIDWPR